MDYSSRNWVSGGQGVTCEVALPQGALSCGPRNYLSGTWGGDAVVARLSPTHAVEGVENLV